MANITQLVIKYIPQLFPAADFEDVLNVENRIELLPQREIEIIKTDKYFQSAANPSSSLKYAIQTKIYDRYYIEVQTTENIAVDNVAVGDYVEIITTEGATYKSQLLEITTDKADTGGTIYTARLTFKSYSNDNDNIINYLTASYIRQRFVDSQLYILQFNNYQNIDTDIDFFGGETFTIYTALYPTISRSDMIINSVKLGNETEVIISSSDWQTYNLTFILTDAELLQFKKYAKRCFYYDSFGNPQGQTLLFGSTNYIAVEPINFEISENNDLVGVNIVNITFKTDLINYFHFA